MFIMTTRRQQAYLSALLAAALCGGSVASAQEGASKPLFATDLGTLGGQRAEAHAINNRGLIVGTDVDQRAGRRPVMTFFVPPGGKLQQLRDFARAEDVNEHDLVIGTVFGASSRTSAFLWTETGGFLDKPTVPSARRTQGIAVDRAGRTAFTIETYPEPVQSVVCEPKGGACTVLPGKPDLHAIANGMSPSGAVVGLLREVTEQGPDLPNIVREQPVFWDADARRLHELPTPLTPDGTAWEGEATDMNDAGTIVGTIWHAGRGRAVAWIGPEHQLRMLGDGAANAINAHDVIVGRVPSPRQDGAEPYYRAHLWDLQRQTSLDFSGFASAPDDVVSADATDINDLGVAVGTLSTAANKSAGSYAVVFDRYAP